MPAQPKHEYSLEEYLEMDRQSEARLEYWNGDIFDMTSAEEEHVNIEKNLLASLTQRLPSSDCHFFPANTRLKVPSFPPYRYSDLSALCGEAEWETISGAEILTNPALIIEVLSDVTEGYDRGEKFSHYKSIPSFSEYLLIAQHRPHITQYIKLDDRTWQQREYNNLNDDLQIVLLNGEIPVRELYRNVTFKKTRPNLRPVE